jgi:hypothetical protein
MSGLEALQRFVEYAIHAFRGRQRFFDSPIDLAAVAVDVENGLGANGKLQNAGGIIALVRPADLKIAEP